MKFDPKLYDDEFFKWHYDNVHFESIEIGESLVKETGITSLIDFGCGIGSYLYGAYMDCDIRGLELSENAKKYTPKKIQHTITYGVDLSKELKLERTVLRPFDASLCIEVAEHIEPSGSEMLIKNITKLTENFCIFTAAPPGQEGTGHINCQEKEYWIGLFKKYKFTLSDMELDSFHHAPDYVRKNLMIFKNESNN